MLRLNEGPQSASTKIRGLSSFANLFGQTYRSYTPSLLLFAQLSSPLNKVRVRPPWIITNRFLFSCIFNHLVLPPQEIRNLVWISECIVQQQRDEIGKYIPLFSESAAWKVARRMAR